MALWALLPFLLPRELKQFGFAVAIFSWAGTGFHIGMRFALAPDTSFGPAFWTLCPPKGSFRGRNKGSALRFPTIDLDLCGVFDELFLVFLENTGSCDLLHRTQFDG